MENVEDEVVWRGLKVIEKVFVNFLNKMVKKYFVDKNFKIFLS